MHAKEKELLSDEAKALEERQGKPRTALSWEDLLLLAGSAEVDAVESQRLSQLVALYPSANPEGVAFAQDLQVAQESIQRLAAQNTVLTWNDGSTAIEAYGGQVKAFQATDPQFKDHGLFNQNSQWTVPSAGSWAGVTDTLPEAWKQQFGERNAALYLRELRNVSSTPEEFNGLAERVSVIASGGIQDVTWDLDTALAMTGAPAAHRALLAKRIAVASDARLLAEGSTLADDAARQLGKDAEVLTASKDPLASVTKISDEMRLDPYHPDWKRYSGNEPRAVGADVVKGDGGAKSEISKTETYFRVEGGGAGSATSQHRITVNDDRSISINLGCSGQLCVSIGNSDHASYFLTNKRPDGSVVVFEADASLHKQMIILRNKWQTPQAVLGG